MPSIDDSAIDRAVAEGVARALSKRAALLRKLAADLTMVIEHHGRIIPLVAPEASTALGTACLFEECAADITDMVRK